MSSIIYWSLFGYLCGSIPFAVVIGRLIVKVDPRTVGDGNPGGTNVWIAGGWKIGLFTAAIEILKGFFPVYLAKYAGLSDWSLVPVALSPIIGHATQPFLGWRGGKALGATGGVWVALIGPLAFPVYAFGAVPLLLFQTENAYSALAGMFALLTFAVFIFDSNWIIVFSILNTGLIFWTHRRELGRSWQWRGWISDLFARRSS